MKIYTRQGDAGGTGLFGGQRVDKDDPRIEACGGLDELMAALGIVACAPAANELVELLQRVQSDLFVLGAQLASPAPQRSPAGQIEGEDILRLEQAIDHYDAKLAPLANFILPGGTPLAAELHWARVVCRQAERRLVTLARHYPIGQHAVPYLNRLSDLLFVLARWANHVAGVVDVIWRPGASSRTDLH